MNVQNQEVGFSCVFPRLLLLQSKSLRPLLSGEFVGRSSETQREMRKLWILSGTAKRPVQPQNQPQKRKNRPEDRSAENSQNGALGEVRTHDLLLRRQSLYPTELRVRSIQYYITRSIISQSLFLFFFRFFLSPIPRNFSREDARKSFSPHFGRGWLKKIKDVV